METPARVTQIHVPAPEEWAASSREYPGIEQGFACVALLNCDPAALEQAYGLVFQETWEAGLGNTRYALLLAPSGSLVILVCHEGSPAWTEVFVGWSTMRTFGRVFAELLHVLPLEEAAIEWKIPCVQVQKNPPWLERHLAALHQADGPWIPLAGLQPQLLEAQRFSHACEVVDEGKWVRIALYHLWSGASVGLRKAAESNQEVEFCLPECYRDRYPAILQETIPLLELSQQDFLWGGPAALERTPETP